MAGPPVLCGQPVSCGVPPAAGYWGPAANPATSPITITAGFATPARRTAAARSRSGAVTTRCRLVQPSDIAAAGVSAPSPAASSAPAIAARWSIAISRTRVIPLRASAAQSTELRGSPGRTCPASTQNPWLSPRCVTGMPAAAGTEIALVTPGITSTGTPAVRQASSSSRPRPNTNGSPPFSRTTARPARACSTSAWLMWSCRIAGPPGTFAASITYVSGDSSSSNSSGASRSATTTSASRSRRSPVTVIRPGSPGPPPTMETRPSGRCPPSGSSPVFSAKRPSASTVATKRSRSAAARRGLRPALTATVTTPDRPVAGTQAADAVASSARTHQIRCRSASAATAALTPGWSVQVNTSQAPSRSPGS